MYQNVTYQRVEGGVKQGNSEIAVAKEIKSETARANYIQSVKHLVMVKLEVGKLKEEHCRSIHPGSLRMMQI